MNSTFQRAESSRQTSNFRSEEADGNRQVIVLGLHDVALPGRSTDQPKSFILRIETL